MTLHLSPSARLVPGTRTVRRRLRQTSTDLREQTRVELADYAASIDLFGLVARLGSPLLVLDPERIARQIHAIQRELPGAEVHFATKALPHPAAIRAVMGAGASFEVASAGETALLAAEGVAIESCLHTHPIRSLPEIVSSYDAGIRRFVVDNPGELAKLDRLPADAEILIRLSFPNPAATSDLSAKFGASERQAVDLAAMAVQSGRRIAGMSFHVGSQTVSPVRFEKAIARTTAMMSMLEQRHGIRMGVLDLGGGFPIPYDDAVPPFGEIARTIRRALAASGRSDKLLVEPGRFVAAPAMTLVSRVVGSARRGTATWHYLDDGLYGSYSNVLTEKVHPLVFAASELVGDGGGIDVEAVTLAGPTCDSIDVIQTGIRLPRLDWGDLLVSPMMGAYTSATATSFNGLPPTPIHVLGEG